MIETELRLPDSMMLTIEKLVCATVVWLYIRAGASRSVANSILRAIRCIITIVFTLLVTALAIQGVTLKVPIVGIPHDIRTAYSRHFSAPKCKRLVCCPECFMIFTCPEKDIPKTCPWKPSRRARACGANLWKQQRTRKGVKMVPACKYTIQMFEPWLKFFSGRKEIDDALHETYRKQTEQPPTSDTEIFDVQDSPAFRNLFQDQPSPYNLIFGIYIDWFSVFKMKIAGELITERERSPLTYFYRENCFMRHHLSVLS